MIEQNFMTGTQDDGIDGYTGRSPARCIVCHRTSDTVVWREAGYQGRLCECGTVYVWPEPPEGRIDPCRPLHPETFYSIPAAFKVDWLAKVRPRGRLLEVGCGEGHFLAAAQARGYEVAGIEPHPVRARRARERLGAPIEERLLEQTRLEPGTFDIVYHTDLLAHFPDPIYALHRMARLLRPGGALVFEVGILGGISPVWYHFLRRLGYPDHRWLYSERGILELLARAGLQVRTIEHFGMIPQVVLSPLTGLYQRPTIELVGLAKRLAARAGRSLDFLPGETAIRRPQAYVENFLRYQVGRRVPPAGPQTLFIEAVPGAVA